LQKVFGLSSSLPDGKKPAKPDQLTGRGIITPKIIESARKARRDRAKARASEQKIAGISAADWKRGKYAFDTETTGANASDVPVTFGLSGYKEDGTKDIIDKFLDFGDKGKTIANIQKAANLRKDGVLLDSAKQLREKLKIKAAESEKVEITDEIWEKEISKNLITPEILAEILKERGITSETAAKKLYNFKGATFDIQKIGRWLEEFYGVNNSPQIRTDL
jgi:hypothetical protein